MDTIRAATIADVSAIGRVDVETWQTTYAGILPNETLAGLSLRQRTAAWTRFVTRRPDDVLVAVNAEQEVLGFGSCGPQRELDRAFTGEVYTLYVLPDFHGRNLGRRLLVALFARLVRSGHNSALVWVVRENPSRFFYERLGGKPVAVKRSSMGRNLSVETVAYGWSDLRDAVESRAKARSRISGDSPTI